MQHLTQHIPTKEARRARAIELLRNGEFESNAFQRAIAKKIMQGVNSGQYRDYFDYDYTENLILSHARYGNVIIMGHSQGNFIANEMFQRFTSKSPSPQNFMRVLSLGSPAASVAYNGYWHNNSEDIVLNTIRSVSPINPLPGNFTLTGQDFLNHGLVTTYLHSSVVGRVVNDAKKEFENMKGEDKECVDWRQNGGGDGVFYYDPIVKHKGLMNLSFSAYSKKNSVSIYNKSGTILHRLGFFSGDISRNFYYDYTKDGILTIVVGAQVSSGDGWHGQITCKI